MVCTLYAKDWYRFLYIHILKRNVILTFFKLFFSLDTCVIDNWISFPVFQNI